VSKQLQIKVMNLPPVRFRHDDMVCKEDCHVRLPCGHNCTERCGDDCRCQCDKAIQAGVVLGEVTSELQEEIWQMSLDEVLGDSSTSGKKTREQTDSRPSTSAGTPDYTSAGSSPRKWREWDATKADKESEQLRRPRHSMARKAITDGAPVFKEIHRAVVVTEGSRERKITKNTTRVLDARTTETIRQKNDRPFTSPTKQSKSPTGGRKHKHQPTKGSPEKVKQVKRFTKPKSPVAIATGRLRQVATPEGSIDQKAVHPAKACTKALPTGERPSQTTSTSIGLSSSKESASDDNNLLLSNPAYVTKSRPAQIKTLSASYVPSSAENAGEGSRNLTVSEDFLTAIYKQSSATDNAALQLADSVQKPLDSMLLGSHTKDLMEIMQSRPITAQQVVSNQSKFNNDLLELLRPHFQGTQNPVIPSHQVNTANPVVNLIPREDELISFD
jgi:hypothetical protein